MKKMLVCFVALSSFFSASIALAVNTTNTKVDLSKYYSTFHPNNSKVVTKTLAAQAYGLPPTNVTVLNYSNETIFVDVVGAFEDEVPTGKADTITHDAMTSPSHLRFSHINIYGIKESFFDDFVCQRAIITVSNYLYNPYVNPQFCY